MARLTERWIRLAIPLTFASRGFFNKAIRQYGQLEVVIRNNNYTAMELTK
ncbi:hypothetical protein QL112_004200 [Xenorhabdus griffiniae]|uniref:Uncharacterized protein n=2 Tax=Xenorhabdus griffiniae TaxID=351672 RepID=A0ABY9XK96_9GAMM|nr:hypothetical protein [Xenorhabdus griffiniae]MBD1226606.1 hypothetical protein [Xenorhabdus griffiniae]WMV73247.1 hypothetical protein QL128_04195 [Xenorhabdus griffiniae]WNH02926.1 hypothetical protein QL112_004200 [Xenorhabdus griffiniae]